METKVDLRKRLLALRDASSIEERGVCSRSICDRLSHLCLSRRITHIAAFWPIGSEVDLKPFFAAHPDWTIFFPKVSTTSPPRLAWGTEPLVPGVWGLSEPEFALHFTPPVQLLLVPGLAFDERGFRLGYGGGYFDALLDHLDGKTLCLGVAFAFQRVDAVPVEAHDIPVQGLLTERSLRWWRDEE